MVNQTFSICICKQYVRSILINSNCKLISATDKSERQFSTAYWTFNDRFRLRLKNKTSKPDFQKDLLSKHTQSWKSSLHVIFVVFMVSIIEKFPALSNPDTAYAVTRSQSTLIMKIVVIPKQNLCEGNVFATLIDLRHLIL